MRHSTRLPLNAFHPRGWPDLPLPRVTGSARAFGTVVGLALLLLCSAFGAVVVHIIEFHLGLGGSGAWQPSALAMLAQCPLSGGLVIVLLGTLATAFALHAEVRSLIRQRTALATQADLVGLHMPGTSFVEPRHPERLLHLVSALFLGQVLLYALAERLWPMGSVMRMNGHVMTMPAHGAIPQLPLHLVVTVAVALAVWRLERRITVLCASIAAVRRLLPLFLTPVCAVPLPSAPAARRLSIRVGPALLSRPPPHVAPCSH